MIVKQDESALWEARFIDREFYTSEEIFKREKETIFAQSWHFACFVNEIKNPGDYFTLTIADQPIVLLRGQDGIIRAFHNACTHRAAILTGERCGNAGKMLRCIYHAWAFDLKGQLVGVPYKEAYGPDFDRSKHDLTPVRCETFENIVFVCLDLDGASLTEFLGEVAPFLAPYMRGAEMIGRSSWIYRGNWKLWNENARDNYHPQFAHRAFNELVPHYADRGGNWALAPGHSRLRWVAEPPNLGAYYRALTRASGVEFDDVEYGLTFGEAAEMPQEVFAIFPTMDCQPGAIGPEEDGGREMRRGFIQVVRPLTVDTSHVDMIIYSSSDDTEEERAVALANLAARQGTWGMVACDDTEAARRCQAGMYTGGQKYSLASRGIRPGVGGAVPDVDARDEYSMREFYRVYKAILGIEGTVDGA